MWGRSAPLSAILVGAVFAATPPLPDGPGKKTLESACTTCHSLDIVTGKKWGREKWQDVVRSNAAHSKVVLSKEETADVVGYLARHFGPQDRGKELVEEICSFCHGLARLKGQAYTRDQWENVTKGMIFEGAPVTEEEFSLILDYLEKNFGPPLEQGKEDK
ncbi:MAG: cytochrome c2 [Bryobacterales bacterium]|nr:cytochrome c2 [Bryobacterales bacterium]